MMKKMRLFRRITATAMVFAMVGITSAFAASSESYGSMTNGKGEIDHIILNDVLPEEEKLSTKSSASPDTEMVISDSPTNGNGEIKHISVDVWAATSNQYTEKNGLTYGTMKQAGVIGEPPDMVSVVATNGMQGWVTLEDFSPVRYLRKIGTSEAEINSYIDKTMNENVQKFIPVYDMEGNVIGEFPTGYSM